MITNFNANNETKIDKLLIDFNTLTNIKICIYDANGDEVGYYPERFSPFCELARRDKDFDTACKNCDKQAIVRCRTTRNAQIYTCHAGLTECVAPIIVGEVIRGFIAFGQIRQENVQPLEENRTQLNENLKKEFDKIPIFSEKIIKATAHVLEACAGYEQFKRFVNSFETALQTRIEEYVKSHLNEDLGIEKLCRQFYCSRKELYSVIKQYYNLTPAEYVKKERLNRACHLLLTTKYSVSKIAVLCGIEDYNYFSKVFKKTFNTSPREYRKLLSSSKK